MTALEARDVRATRATVTQVEIIEVGDLERAFFPSRCWAWRLRAKALASPCPVSFCSFNSQLYPLRKWELLCLPRPHPAPSLLSWLVVGTIFS